MKNGNYVVFSFRMLGKLSGPIHILIGLLVFSSLCSTSGFAQEDREHAVPPIDFSYAGYENGGREFPSPRAVLRIEPTGNDDTALIQAAIDHLSKFPVKENGLRGAVLLSPGRFYVSKQLNISTSGVVIKGSGDRETTIVATGNDRYTVIRAGNNNAPHTTKNIWVINDSVPAGTMKVKLETVNGLQKGDRIVLTRPSTKEWISSLGMDTISGTFADLRFHWPEGSRNLVWDRKIDSVDLQQKQIILDAPITNALVQKYGGGRVAKVNKEEPINHIGIENLIIESEYNQQNLKDEEHAWYGIALDNIEDTWVLDITARHLVNSAVLVGPRSRRITIFNCRNEAPVSETGGYRRHSFLVEGQQVLIQNCSADYGINDFATGLLASGPNVFLNCIATNALGASGSYESYASGVLYENVYIEGNDLRLTYDLNRAQAGGWTAANSVIWNCTANELLAQGPQAAPVVTVNSPDPLYYRLLARRTGKDFTEGKRPNFKGHSKMNLSKFSTDDVPLKLSPPEPETIPLNIINGRFVTGNSVAWGGSVNDAWWLGQTTPANALDAGVSITRYVPGRTGPGLTENLPDLMNRIVEQGTPFYQSGPAIWYDRRRDDHSIIERSNGNVWAAFYELPWARSGKGIAWDGLSKYDLARYNPWYFKRTKEFARLADQNGIILYHHLYNNHNLLETASHWIDYPWRPANNINKTGLPEPPPLEPNDRIHVAKDFYDTKNPDLRELHRSYIFHVLDQLGSFENIIFGLSFQYSGPASFQRFFQSTVAEWEKRNNKKVRLVIDTGKNVTDEILNDPELSQQIAVIDMRYWHYLPDGTLWAPEAGQNKAFRELHPREFGDPTTPEQIYRQVREYHEKYPGKAIVSWHSGVNPVPALMAGGAQVLMRNPTAGHGQGRDVDYHPIDSFVRMHLSKTLMYMEPVDGILTEQKSNWVLADKKHEQVLIYSLRGEKIEWNQDLNQKSFSGTWFNPESGLEVPGNLPNVIEKGTVLKKPSAQDWLLLLSAND